MDIEVMMNITESIRHMQKELSKVNKPSWFILDGIIFSENDHPKYINGEYVEPEYMSIVVDRLQKFIEANKK